MAVIPWIAIPLVPLGIIFFVLRSYFLETSRDVKRLESTSEYRDSQVGMARKLASLHAKEETPEIVQTPYFTMSHEVNIS